MYLSQAGKEGSQRLSVFFVINFFTVYFIMSSSGRMGGLEERKEKG